MCSEALPLTDFEPEARSRLPSHITALVDYGYNGNNDFNSRLFTVALWFVGHDLSEDDYFDFVSTSSICVGYKRNDLGKRIRKTYLDAEDKYDPALAGGSAAPGFAEDMTELLTAVEADPKHKNKAVCLALIQHAINTGRNPVHASSRQLAAINGNSIPVTGRSMNRLAESKGGGLLHEVTYDGVYGHSRLWHIDPCYRPQQGYICTCKNICNPPTAENLDPESRFVEYVESLPVATELTVTTVASALSITRPRARKLLDKYTAEYFGGGFYPGDRKTRTPAKWWKELPYDERQRQSMERVANRKANYNNRIGTTFE